MRRARRCAGLLVGALALLLSGCTLTGHLVIHTSGRVDVDLQYTPQPSLDNVRLGIEGCHLDSATIDTLDFTRVRPPDGNSVCRVTGWATAADLQRVFGVVRRVGDQFQVEFFPGGQVPDAVAEYTASRIDVIDVTVTFPGPVTEHLGGRVSGTTIRWTDHDEFVANRGLAASGAADVVEEPSPVPPWTGPAVGGLGLGVVAGVAGGLWAGRRRAAATASAPSADASAPPGSPASPRPSPAGPDEDWSHE